jgi:WD40-like Beta Propeller Repeat
MMLSRIFTHRPTHAMPGKIFRLMPLALATPLMFAAVSPSPHQSSDHQSPDRQSSDPGLSLPVPQIFAPGVISGPANDGAPTFSPDGNVVFFTRSTAHWTAILESHKAGDGWSRPTLAPFSGEWPDSSPAMSPDGSYIVFQSTRPALPLATPPKEGTPIPGIVSNLWRVNRLNSGWSQPERLPDTVNISHSIWKPSIAADGAIYFTNIDQKGGKRLYSAKFANGVYQQAQPLSFSDGTTLDVDPEVAPDGSFLVFCSAGRFPGDDKDHLFIVKKDGDGWGKVATIRYAGDEKPYGFSTDDEPRLGPDHRTIYFSSDRVVPVHFPRTHEQAQQDLERLELWDNSNTNVWSISISAWLSAAPQTSSEHI